MSWVSQPWFTLMPTISLLAIRLKTQHVSIFQTASPMSSHGVVGASSSITGVTHTYGQFRVRNSLLSVVRVPQSLSQVPSL